MPWKRDHDRRLLGFARRMRREPTDAERKLWQILRGQKVGGFKFRRQHPIGGYIVDFYCLEAALVVEADGGQHADPDQREYDQRRTEHLAQLGIRVLRFTDYEVLKHPEADAGMIYRSLTGEDPHPGPLPAYRERE